MENMKNEKEEKATNHMDFLRMEYVALSNKYNDLEKRYNELLSVANVRNKSADIDDWKSPFAQKLIAKISEVYDKDLFSDLTIHCDGHQLRGHRLLIFARTDYWGDLSAIDRIEFKDLPYNIGCAVLKWMYTDDLDDDLNDRDLMEICAAAVKFFLIDLQKKCELLLLKRTDSNEKCLLHYEFAVENNLAVLKEHCVNWMRARWDHFNVEDFANMSASLLYRLIDGRSKNALHTIIRLRRTDLLFRYFTEHSSELYLMCNEEGKDLYALELALEMGQLEIATLLVGHQADVNFVDTNGQSLLIRSLQRNKIGTLKFLIENGARIDQKIEKTGENLLHIAASTKCSIELLNYLMPHLDRLNVNDVDCDSKTALIRAVEWENMEIIDFLLMKPTTDINKTDRSGRSPIAIALFEVQNMTVAAKLANREADLNILYKDTYMIHYAVKIGNLDVVKFLCKSNVDVNQSTEEGLVPLQIAIDHRSCNLELIRVLLQSGANIAHKTMDSSATLLHYVIGKERGEEILELFSKNENFHEDMFKAIDENGDTPLAKALLNGKFRNAEILIQAGADVNEKNAQKRTLLMRIISEKLDDASLFLLKQGAGISEDISVCFAMAIEYKLVKTVCHICAMTYRYDKHIQAMLIWTALIKGSFEIAKDLINICGPDIWFIDENNKCRQNLLHKALNLGLQDVATFLIDNDFNIDAPQQGQISDKFRSGDTPLLACIRSGFDDVAIRLIKHGAKLDRQDTEGCTAIHLAVYMQNAVVISELLSNCHSNLLLEANQSGNTPLDLAINYRNFTIADALIKKAPNLLLQANNESGELLLHRAVREADLELLLFLIACNADIDARAQNGSKITALHLSACFSNEIIVRNLILAGADINATTSTGFTPLHFAAYENHENLCMILLENGAELNATDMFGNTPLHIAVSRGSVASVNVLVADSRLNLRAVNDKQQNALFLTAGDLSRTNSLDILQMFLNVDPDFPLDAKDINGFTVFLLAYLKGNENFCRALLRCGVCLGTVSYQGISVFKHETPTKQLLFSLLDKLERKPSWADGDSCSECEIKFSFRMRKHHCRHCGRLVCANCSEQTIPILKYGIEKPVRVCQICCDILTMGPA